MSRPLAAAGSHDLQTIGMRVLVVAIGPLAGSGYATRIGSMIAAYKDRGWQVDLVQLALQGEEVVSPELFADVAAHTPITMPATTWTDQLSLLPPVARLASASVSNSLRKPYDLAQAESTAAWPVVQRADASTRLLVLHDDEVARQRRLARQPGSPLRKAARRATAMKYSRLQRSGVRNADRIWFVSDVEQDRVDPKRENSIVVPNGADSTFFAADTRQVVAPVAMFVGPAAYGANRQAADHYVASILPLVRRVVPEAQLWLVGRGWADFAQREAGVIDRGFVDDLPAELARAAVVVAPLLTGSGTKIKVIEAMAAARPVVATTVAAEAIPSSRGLHVHDDAGAFAAAVAALLQDPDTRLGDGNANRVAVSSLEWQSIWARATADIERLVHAARGSATLDR